VIWSRTSDYCLRADTGHQVSATRHGPADAARWQFTAWAPNDRPELTFWKWKETIVLKVHYARGEPVPQRSQCLGIYPSAEAARAACEADHNQQQDPNHA
jgi:hypothetical protein